MLAGRMFSNIVVVQVSSPALTERGSEDYVQNHNARFSVTTNDNAEVREKGAEAEVESKARESWRKVTDPYPSERGGHFTRGGGPSHHWVTGFAIFGGHSDFPRAVLQHMWKVYTPQVIGVVRCDTLSS